MRRILLIVYLFIIGVVVAPRLSAAIHGSWHGEARDDDRSMQLTLSYEDNDWSHTVERAGITGLTDAQIHSNGNAPVRFTLARDAGTITFDGIFGDGEGGGRFTFSPNESYARDLRGMGISATDLDDHQLLSLAILDVSAQFIRDMQALGYKGPLEDYKRFRIHGVSPQFVRDLQAAGYHDLSADDLVRFRIHGVSPEFIRGMKDLGYQPSPDDLVRFRIHGVSPEYVKAFATYGYRNLSGDDLVRFRIHGVSPELVKALDDCGYHHLAADDLVRFCIHGVSPEYVHALKELGYTPDADQLVRMRIHGVSAEFIRSVKSAGYDHVPVDKLIEMRIRGIDAQYLKAMSK